MNFTRSIQAGSKTALKSADSFGRSRAPLMQPLESRVLLSATYQLAQVVDFTGGVTAGLEPPQMLAIDASGNVYGFGAGPPVGSESDSDTGVTEIPAGSTTPQVVQGLGDDVVPEALAVTPGGTVHTLAINTGGVGSTELEIDGQTTSTDVTSQTPQLALDSGGAGYMQVNGQAYTLAESLAQATQIPLNDGNISLIAADGSNDLFAVDDGQSNSATPQLYEYVASNQTVEDVTFGSGLGTDVNALITDSQGDLFGTTAQGGANGNGTVFEVVAGTTTATKLADFPANVSNQGDIAVDSTGNVFGVSTTGGASGNGEVWELASGATSINTAYSFDGSEGTDPTGGVVIDSQGDLFGATDDTSASTGTVYELTPLPQPSQLAFSQQPTATTTNTAITPAITVDVEDSSGNIVTTDDSDVTLSIASGPTGATISGTVTVQAVNGVATFNDLSLPTAGTYTLSATDSSLTAATSDSFAITASTSTGTGSNALEFSTTPADSTAGTKQTVSIDLDNGSGTLITKGHPTFTVKLLNSSSNAVQTLHATAKAGVATVKNVTTKRAGTYTLVVTDGKKVTEVSSSPFTISAGAPQRLAFVGRPGNVRSTDSFNVRVDLLDKYGNIVTGNTSAVTLSLLGKSSATLTGTTTVDATNGVAIFDDLSIATTGTYSLKATDGSLKDAISDSFKVKS